MRILLALLLLVHGAIHFAGFGRAFAPDKVTTIHQNIGKGAGLLWLAAAVSLIGAAVFYLANRNWWWMPAAAGAVLSQCLLISVCREARWGTIANLLLLAAVLAGAAAWHFASQYHRDATSAWQQTAIDESEILTEADLVHLPIPVQRYLRVTGCVGKPKVRQAVIRFSGQMREKGKPFFLFTSEQQNFFPQGTRLFFMRANIKGLPTAGYHRYASGHAVMTIKLLSAIPVVKTKGGELDGAETVTLFNDMCVLAPATLIDPRIGWECIDSNRVAARFSNAGITIGAELLFNAAGELVNFYSDDRYALTEGKLQRFKFSTPVGNYRDYGGYRLASTGEAVWHFPDGPFVYGKFQLRSVQYNKRPGY